ncbi:hypothetical protein ASPTUDRAFT_29816 [Aspergillus tubingensis CBS 134.48]|uniref:Uncharacterized protein n=1 Tax=Aspergillus tubingensis (strain CBS 134.48) TaxID=767770 RepID=A0A1L9N3F1_ASPTC|nr:hypothetical protein ASPTUDRAFT_29816 [Aspergillus tubingensis CBS 134.48]
MTDPMQKSKNGMEKLASYYGTFGFYLKWVAAQVTGFYYRGIIGSGMCVDVWVSDIIIRSRHHQYPTARHIILTSTHLGQRHTSSLGRPTDRQTDRAADRRLRETDQITYTS